MERRELVEGLQRLADSVLDDAMQAGCDACLAGRPRESNPFKAKDRRPCGTPGTVGGMTRTVTSAWGMVEAFSVSWRRMANGG